MSGKSFTINETDFAMKLGETAQECFKSKQLVPHTLYLVEFIPPNNDLHAHIALLEKLHPLCYFRVFTFNIQAPDVDSHRKHGDVNKLSFPRCDALRYGFKAQNATHGLTEMAGKVGSLETNEVRGEKTMQAMAYK